MAQFMDVHTNLPGLTAEALLEAQRIHQRDGHPNDEIHEITVTA